MHREQKFEFSLGNVLLLSLPLIIFLGIVKMVVYYSQFNLSIIEYLSVGELAIYFVQDWDFYILLLFPLVIIISLSNRDKDAELIVGVLSALFLVTILLISDQIYNPSNVFFALLSFNAVFTVCLPFIDILILYFKKKKGHDFTLWTAFSVFLFICLLMTFSKGYLEAREIKEKKSYLGTQIILTDSTVKISDSTYYFIGKTEDYVFCFNEKDSTTESYPIGIIKYLKIKKKKRIIAKRRDDIRPRSMPTH